MKRVATQLTVAVVVSVILALALLVIGRLIAGESVDEAAATGAHHLFLFMDVGIGVWVLLLVIRAVRTRQGATSATTLLFALIGVVANLLTVTIVGFVQTGAVATEFIGFALQAGVAFVLAVAIVVVAARAATRRARHARVARTPK